MFMFLSFVFGFSGLIFGLLVKQHYFYSLDLLVGRAFQTFQPFWLVEFNRFISVFELAIFFIAPVWLILLLRRRQTAAAKLILLAVFAWVINRLLKLGFGLACPTPAELMKFGVSYSFTGLTSHVFGSRGFFNPLVCYPSGHVFNYVSFWGTTFFLRAKITANKIGRKIIAFVSVGLMIFVGPARISLGAHWFSDVIGGYLLGFSWLFLLIFIYHQFLTKKHD